MTYDDLVKAARRTAKNSYSPYSGFKVGCAALFDASPTTICGTNVENASYGLTICAERAAIFSGVSNGFQRLRVLAISCRDKENKPIRCFSPCGACLQVMAEFSDENTVIVLDKIGPFKLQDFMRAPFALMRSVSGSSAV